MASERRTVDRYCTIIDEFVLVVEDQPYYWDRKAGKRVYKRGRVIKCLNAVECGQSRRPGERVCCHLDDDGEDPLEVVRDL